MQKRIQSKQKIKIEVKNPYLEPEVKGTVHNNNDDSVSV